MAREKETAKAKHASVKPSEAEGGGGIGFPTGAIVTITDAAWTTWEEAGEKALKGGREADDPALMLVGDVEGADEPKTEFLGAGKANRLTPSKDGEYLDVAEGSTAAALSDSCNAKVFLDSVFMKDKNSEAYKLHKKMAVSEDALDDGIRAAVIGLKFKVGRKVIERDFQEEGRGKPRPTLFAEEILEQPSGDGKPAKASSKTSSKRRDEDEEDEKPARGRSSKAEPEADEGDDDTAAEKAVLEVLELPKNRKGIAVDKLWSAVYNVVKGEDNEKAVTDLVEDEKWVRHKKRPWTVDDDMVQAG